MMDLWDYQSDDIHKIENALEAGEAPLYVLPTGGGKTVVASALIDRAVEHGQRVLVLTHRREILMQTSRRPKPSAMQSWRGWPPAKRSWRPIAWS
jgi:DNA repair protein RadD